jgi:hypothetical protein
VKYVPKFASTEDAPHFLKLLVDYGKSAVTLSLALLTLSVAFVDKVFKFPVDIVQVVLVVLLWACLFLALVAGLVIAAQLTGVASNYMRALHLAYPDALEVIRVGTSVKLEDPDEQITITDPRVQQNITEALNRSKSHTVTASHWAEFSFWMFGLSALLIIAIGVYSLIYRGLQIDASSAVESSAKFVQNQYKLLPDSIELRGLTYDEKDKTYTVEIRNKQAANEGYKITINASSGGVTKTAKSP